MLIRGRQILFNADGNGVYIDNTLFLFQGTKFKKILGAGANGIVFHVNNEFLNREEALKIWIKTKSNDKRNKIYQGILESQKIVSSKSSYVVDIYSAGINNDHYFITMEYINGVPLKHFYKSENSIERWSLALDYIDAIEAITTNDLFHGDPHGGNVIVSKIHGQIKIIDFGTSSFNGKNKSIDRHWNVFNETMIILLSKIDGYEHWTGRFKPRSGRYAWRDILEGLRMELQVTTPKSDWPRSFSLPI